MQDPLHFPVNSHATEQIQFEVTLKATLSPGCCRMWERGKSNVQLTEREAMEWKEIRRQIKEETRKAVKEENLETYVCMYICMYIGEILEGNCHQLLFLWKPSQIDANSPISFVISVRTSVCLYVYSMYHLSSHWMEFHEIYFWDFSYKSVENFKTWLKSGKKLSGILHVDLSACILLTATHVGQQYKEQRY